MARDTSGNHIRAHVPVPAVSGEIAPISRRQTMAVLLFHVGFLLWTVLMPARATMVSVINQALVVTMAIGSLVVISGAIFELELPTFSPQQQAHIRAMKRGVILLGISVCFQVLQAVHKAYLMFGDSPTPFPNSSDYWLFPAMLCAIGAVFIMPGMRPERTVRNRLFLDQLVLTSALAALAWYFIIGPALQHANSNRHAILFASAGCLLALLGVASVATLASRVHLPTLNRVKRCLMTSMGLALLSQLLGMVAVIQWADPGQMLGIHVSQSLSLIFLAWAARFWVRLDARDVLRGETREVWWRQVVSYGPVVPAFIVTCLVVWKGAGGVVAQGVYPCSLFMMIAILLRQFSTINENVRLNNSLQDALKEVEAKNSEVYVYVQELETAALNLAHTQDELERSYRALKDKNRQSEEYTEKLRAAMEAVEAKNRQVVGYARQVETANGKLIEMQNTLSQSLAEVEVMRIDLQKSNEGLMAANHMLLHSASVDGMTGLWNHATFQERLAEAAAQYHRNHQPFCLMLIDVDHFKQYNDSFGHQAGDEALKIVADLLKNNIRSADVVARYGGEEFAVLLRNTNFMYGYAAAERIRKLVEEASFPKRDVTISIGLAGSESAEGVPARVVASADAAMYVSKHLGRNRVTVYEYVEWDDSAVEAQPLAA